MADLLETLSGLRGTRFGPVHFESTASPDEVLHARFMGVEVEVLVDGDAVRATRSLPPGSRGEASMAFVRSLADLVEVHDAGQYGDRQLEGNHPGGGTDEGASVDRPALAVSCWVSGPEAGLVARAVRLVALACTTEEMGQEAATRAAGTRSEALADAPSQLESPSEPEKPVLSEADERGAAASHDEAVSIEGLGEDMEEVMRAMAAACSAGMAEGVRALLLGEREQIMLGRPQLDEFTGAVMGPVTVFNVGAGSAGGITVHAMLGNGRVADVEVFADAAGIRVVPDAEGAEVKAGLQAVADILARSGRRVARIAAAGDAVVVATEVVATEVVATEVV